MNSHSEKEKLVNWKKVQKCWCNVFTLLPNGQLHMLNKLWIEKGEAHKLCLVKVHHEEFISGCKIGLLWCELFVKITNIFAMFLKWTSSGISLKFLEQRISVAYSLTYSGIVYK